jgi:hypothetical protein
MKVMDVVAVKSLCPCIKTVNPSCQQWHTAGEGLALLVSETKS